MPHCCYSLIALELLKTRLLFSYHLAFRCRMRQSQTLRCYFGGKLRLLTTIELPRRRNFTRYKNGETNSLKSCIPQLETNTFNYNSRTARIIIYERLDKFSRFSINGKLFTCKKHVPCFYPVIETRMEVFREREILWEHESQEKKKSD